MSGGPVALSMQGPSMQLGTVQLAPLLLSFGGSSAPLDVLEEESVLVSTVGESIAWTWTTGSGTHIRAATNAISITPNNTGPTQEATADSGSEDHSILAPKKAKGSGALAAGSVLGVLAVITVAAALLTKKQQPNDAVVFSSDSTEATSESADWELWRSVMLLECSKQ